MRVKNFSSIALSDWDLTFSKDFTIKPWVEFLASRNFFNPKELNNIKCYFKKFDKFRIPYEDLCTKVGFSYCRGLKGQTRHQITEAAKSFCSSGNLQLYSFAHKAIFSLHARGIEVVVITGAPVEPLRVFSSRFKFKLVGGLIPKISPQNYYTGELLINSGISIEKERLVKRVTKNRKVVIAFGDSESDLPLINPAQLGIMVGSPQMCSERIEAKHIRYFTPQELSETIESIIFGIHL